MAILRSQDRGAQQKKKQDGRAAKTLHKNPTTTLLAVIIAPPDASRNTKCGPHFGPGSALLASVRGFFHWQRYSFTTNSVTIALLQPSASHSSLAIF